MEAHKHTTAVAILLERLLDVYFLVSVMQRGSNHTCTVFTRVTLFLEFMLSYSWIVLEYLSIAKQPQLTP
ncbi:hypothetical protein PC123_g24947 [Phytophthora cactorum]|nr:hypothetical protein PC123_g24947 [Phytophthora cactorum]